METISIPEGIARTWTGRGRSFKTKCGAENTRGAGGPHGLLLRYWVAALGQWAECLSFAVTCASAHAVAPRFDVGTRSRLVGRAPPGRHCRRHVWLTAGCTNQHSAYMSCNKASLRTCAPGAWRVTRLAVAATCLHEENIVCASASPTRRPLYMYMLRTSLAWPERGRRLVGIQGALHDWTRQDGARR